MVPGISNILTARGCFFGLSMAGMISSQRPLDDAPSRPLAGKCVGACSSLPGRTAGGALYLSLLSTKKSSLQRENKPAFIVSTTRWALLRGGRTLNSSDTTYSLRFNSINLYESSKVQGPRTKSGWFLVLLVYLFVSIPHSSMHPLVSHFQVLCT